eukprot:CAMPEP_0119316498 /NCGR_PEP_ID=MMETSP1333-20130426/39799_1 /TAXON_ID=418940 /ORGANISM="Scyphosphaera apsteinii, Strain RCC1455" /LENGTH=301 /DNA_ID=CAMNT_0007322159 /DNA_START=185 /DNA_END=1090 /DNA_ORIENTATION=+
MELPEQAAYKAALRAGRTEAMTAAAKAMDKESHKKLNALRSLPENAECFDCSARKPGWAALPHGIFICIDCAQIHRNLGRHISQVKAVNTGTYLWFPHEIAVMEAVGNLRANLAYSDAPTKLDASTPASIKMDRARAKYEEHRWDRCAKCLPSSASPSQLGSSPTNAPQAALPAAAPRASSASRRRTSVLPARRVDPTTLPAIPPAPAQPNDLILWDEPFTATSAPADLDLATSTPTESSAPTSMGKANAMLALQGHNMPYEKKKASVLSLYNVPATLCAPPCSYTGNGALKTSFFAQYGL